MKFPKGCKMEEVKSDQLAAVSDGSESLAVGGARMSLLTELPSLGSWALRYCGVLPTWGRGGGRRWLRCLHYEGAGVRKCAQDAVVEEMFTSCTALLDLWVGELCRWVWVTYQVGQDATRRRIRWVRGANALTPKTCFRHGVSKHVDQNLPHISGFISEEYIKSLSYYLLSWHPPDYVGKLVTQAFLQMTFQTEDPRTGVRNCQLPRTSPLD